MLEKIHGKYKAVLLEVKIILEEWNTMKQGESYTLGKERTSVRPMKFQLNQYVLNIKKKVALSTTVINPETKHCIF